MWVNALSGGATEIIDYDPYWANVKLLIPCTGTDTSTSFTDQSTFAHTITANGNAQVDTAQVAGGELLLDGTGDFLSAPSSSAFDLGSSDFCGEMYARFNALPTAGSQSDLICRWTNGSDSLREFDARIRNDAGVYAFQLSISTDGANFFNKQITWSTPSTSTLYHLAFVRSGTTLTFYVNGTSQGTASLTETIYSPASAVRLLVGVTNSATEASPTYTFGFNGWMSAIRLTVGNARYTGNFTPPALPLPPR